MDDDPLIEDEDDCICTNGCALCGFAKRELNAIRAREERDRRPAVPATENEFEGHCRAVFEWFGTLSAEQRDALSVLVLKDEYAVRCALSDAGKDWLRSRAREEIAS